MCIFVFIQTLISNNYLIHNLDLSYINMSKEDVQSLLYLNKVIHI